MVRRRQLKKVVTFQTAVIKNRVTPSVAAPGETNPSDAAGQHEMIIKPVCVASVSPTASTLTVAFFDRFSPKLAQT